jgi:hypothetical protein
LSSIWSDWRSVLAIVKPETVIAWHRIGFARSGLRRCGAANPDDLSFPGGSEI